jgi:hypothetical protein
MSTLLISFWANSHVLLVARVWKSAQRKQSGAEALPFDVCVWQIFSHQLSLSTQMFADKENAFVFQSSRASLTVQFNRPRCWHYQWFHFLNYISAMLHSHHCTFTQWAWEIEHRKPFINWIMWAWWIAKWNRAPPRRHNTIHFNCCLVSRYNFNSIEGFFSLVCVCFFSAFAEIN